jgi:hypothetical protein
MDSLTDEIHPAFNSSIASSVIYIGCAVFITVIAFRSKIGHAIGCVATGGLYCMIYGFLQGKGTIAPAIVMIVSFVVGSGSLIYAWNTGLLTG